MVRYRYFNEKTEELVELDRLIKDRDVMPDDSGDWRRVVEAPNFTKASYLDGQKRPASEGFDAVKTAAKLKVARAEAMTYQEKQRIDKEISKVEKTK